MGFNWKWYLKDIKQDKDVNVFSCFACAGGSTMGYKRAGFKVLGCCEIDERVNNVYIRNHHPKYNFLMDLREFNALDNSRIPEELFHLDILDGSPPCSTFSIAGQREKTWGKEKAFREGQKVQILDDLFFVFLDTVEKLKPKIIIAENVPGLLFGNAKGYVNEIIKRFIYLGYDVQLFKLNSAYMDVPQVRERVFFIANNQHYPKLKLSFNGKPITFGEIKSEKGKKVTGKDYELLKYASQSDKYVSWIEEKIKRKRIGNFRHIIYDNEIAPTLVSAGCDYRGCDKLKLSDDDLRNIQTFPQDYDFMSENVRYICGMSVPPNMMANIALKIWEQWLNGKTKDSD